MRRRSSLARQNPPPLPRSHELTPASIAQVAALLARATHVLITAGAGMSVDAGFDYNSEEQFVRRYPVMARRGPRCRYHMFGYPWPSEAAQWGHIARHLQELRYSPPPDATPYLNLRTLTNHADRFVLTSNADDLFERNGFDAMKVWTRQGSYSRLQCLAACDPSSTWLAEPWVQQAARAVDLQTEELKDPALWPRCPRCKGQAMMNVRGGDWFIETPYEVQGERFATWLLAAQAGRLLVLDVGSGFNTPSVVRWPAEQIAARHADADLVRVNRFRPEVPAQPKGRTLGLACDGSVLWAALASSHP